MVLIHLFIHLPLAFLHKLTHSITHSLTHSHFHSEQTHSINLPPTLSVLDDSFTHRSFPHSLIHSVTLIPQSLDHSYTQSLDTVQSTSRAPLARSLISNTKSCTHPPTDSLLTFTFIVLTYSLFPSQAAFSVASSHGSCDQEQSPLTWKQGCASRQLRLCGM